MASITVTNPPATPTTVPTITNVAVVPSGVSASNAVNLVQQNTFAGANMQFSNVGLQLLVGEIINFRTQLVVRPEFQSQSGWDDALNTFMLAGLNELASTIKSITYVAPTTTLSGGAAVVTSLSANPVSGAVPSGSTPTSAPAPATVTPENVVLPPAYKHNVVWDLSGNSPNIPQVNPTTIPNNFGRAFITLLDRLFVESTRLDSRHQVLTITQYESAMLGAMLNQMYSLLQQFGGSANQTATPAGTLPSQESQTFQGAPGVAVSASS